MPRKLHNKLTKAAKKKGLSGDRRKAYVYGTLRAASSKRKGRR